MLKKSEKTNTHDTSGEVVLSLIRGIYYRCFKFRRTVGCAKCRHIGGISAHPLLVPYLFGVCISFKKLKGVKQCNIEHLFDHKSSCCNSMSRHYRLEQVDSRLQVCDVYLHDIGGVSRYCQNRFPAYIKYLNLNYFAVYG